MSGWTCNMSCLKVILKPSLILLNQGLVPSNNKQGTRILKTTLHCVVYILLFSLLALNVLKGIRMNKTMFVNRMICLIIPGLNMLAKWLGIRINEKHYLWILENLKSDIFNTPNKKLNRHLQMVERISGVLLRYFAITTGALFLAACALPIILETQPLVPCPVDLGQYQILYSILHLPLTLYFATNSPCLDALLMSLLAICIAQLGILEEQLNSLRGSDTYNSDSHQEEINCTLRECLSLHKMIIEYVDNMNVVLSLPLFIQYTCGCFVICNAILQLTIMKGKSTADTMGIVAYTCVTFSQLAAYHWLGNEIMYKSNNVVEACYLSKWYRLDIISQKYLFLLMERAKKPLIIKSYTIVYISLESLAVIIRWSYSLFALIKATYS